MAACVDDGGQLIPPLTPSFKHGCVGYDWTAAEDAHVVLLHFHFHGLGKRITCAASHSPSRSACTQVARSECVLKRSSPHRASLSDRSRCPRRPAQSGLWPAAARTESSSPDVPATTSMPSASASSDARALRTSVGPSASIRRIVPLSAPAPTPFVRGDPSWLLGVGVDKWRSSRPIPDHRSRMRAWLLTQVMLSARA